jgi:hypothetical protein
MTKKQIIEMARQAGVRDDENVFEFSQFEYLERFANLVAEHEREAWPEEPTGHMARGVTPSKISNAITELYALFGAAHNADINLTGLNIVLNNLAQQEQGEPPQRTWQGLTDEEVENIADSEYEEVFVRWIEAKLKEKNND